MNNLQVRGCLCFRVRRRLMRISRWTMCLFQKQLSSNQGQGTRKRNEGKPFLVSFGGMQWTCLFFSIILKFHKNCNKCLTKRKKIQWWKKWKKQQQQKRIKINTKYIGIQKGLACVVCPGYYEHICQKVAWNYFTSFDGSPSLDFLQQKFSCLQRKEHFHSKQLTIVFVMRHSPWKAEIAASLECLYNHVAEARDLEIFICCCVHWENKFFKWLEWSGKSILVFVLC